MTPMRFFLTIWPSSSLSCCSRTWFLPSPPTGQTRRPPGFNCCRSWIRKSKQINKGLLLLLNFYWDVLLKPGSHWVRQTKHQYHLEIEPTGEVKERKAKEELATANEEGGGRWERHASTGNSRRGNKTERGGETSLRTYASPRGERA